MTCRQWSLSALHLIEHSPHNNDKHIPKLEVVAHQANSCRRSPSIKAVHHPPPTMFILLQPDSFLVSVWLACHLFMLKVSADEKLKL